MPTREPAPSSIVDFHIARGISPDQLPLTDTGTRTGMQEFPLSGYVAAGYSDIEEAALGKTVQMSRDFVDERASLDVPFTTPRM